MIKAASSCAILSSSDRHEERKKMREREKERKKWKGRESGRANKLVLALVCAQFKCHA